MTMSSGPANPDKRPSIAILGAGIAGLALAIGLLKRNVPCTIYEAGDAFSAIGAGIGLGPNSLAAMDLIDPSFRSQYDAVKTTNEREEFRHSVFDALYAEEGFGTKRGWTRGLVGAPYFERSSGHRKELLEIMKSFIPPGTVRFSKRVTEMKQVGSVVVLHFADGEQISVDAVIGADGVRGISRQAVLGDSAPELVAPKYVGKYAYRGIIPMKDAKEILDEHGGDAKMFMASGRTVAIYPISKGTQETFVFFVKDKSESWDGESDARKPCSKEEMLADFEDVDPRLKKILDWAQPLKWPLFHHPETPTYYHGRICMIGDVAHAMSPHQAAGAGQGLEDAVVLAHLLTLVEKSDQLEAAFRIYDDMRRPRAQKVVTTSNDAGLMYSFMDPEMRDDLGKIVENGNQRLHWIWQHNIVADLKEVEERFLRTVALEDADKTKTAESAEVHQGYVLPDVGVGS